MSIEDKKNSKQGTRQGTNKSTNKSTKQSTKQVEKKQVHKNTETRNPEARKSKPRTTEQQRENQKPKKSQKPKQKLFGKKQTSKKNNSERSRVQQDSNSDVSWDLPIQSKNQRRVQSQLAQQKGKKNTASRDAIDERDRKKTNERRMQFYYLLVVGIIMLYFGSNIYRMFIGSNVNHMQLEKIVVDTPKMYDALIVRTEKLVNTTVSGEVDYKIANNEKARVGDLVCTIVDSTVENNDFSISTEEFTEGSKIYNADIDNINERIKSEFSYSKISDYSQAYIYAEKIYESMEVRNQIIVSQLSDTNASSINSSSAVKESLYTVNSGVISYNIDSYEEKYTPDTIDAIEYNDIRDVIKADSVTRNKVVSANDNVFKVMESNTWNLVAFVNTEEIKSRNITPNKVMEVYISKSNTYVPINATVVSIVEGDKTSKIVFECDSYMIDYSDQRVVSIKLAKENVEGYKVPKTAIKQKDAVVINNEFIYFNEEGGYDYVVKAGYNGEKYEVPIVKYSTVDNNSYVLKDTTDLNKGDMLLNGDRQYQIPDIYTINGVYVLNTGLATFKEVNTSYNTLEDNSVVFLEFKNNPNIRIHDTIAVDVTEVSENEIIY